MKARFKSIFWNIQRKKKTFNQKSKKKKEFPQNEDRLRSFWDNFKHTDFQNLGVPEGEEKEQEIENLFEKNDR